MLKKTVVLGASPDSDRFSYKAVRLLQSYKQPVVAIGIRDGKIGDVEIVKDKPEISDVHTVSLYLNPEKQIEYYDYIIKLNPRRIIFNPGTENEELYKIAAERKIDVVVNCTLVMLNNSIF